ncbi:MAG: alkaline phosphatase [Ruminococcaceae bacterium]|nr:alkaline phosphatase [Oscillospiraceae bacterium]
MTKRLLSLLFAILLIISVVACKSAEVTDSGESDNGTTITDGGSDSLQSDSDSQGGSGSNTDNGLSDNKEPEVYDAVYIDGVNIENYTLVIPSMDDIYAYYTALSINDYFNNVYGYYLLMLTADMGESDCEILIGDTGREESNTGLDFKKGEYTLYKKGDKVVLDGYGVYVGAGMGELISKYLTKDGAPCFADIKDIPNTAKKSVYAPTAPAKNVILMIGDGMGYNHVEAALKNGLISEFAAKDFMSVGSSVTRSQSVLNGDATYTDSAAAATALATGYKTINGYIGKDANKNDIKNVRELAHEFGALTAVITTDVITGATPGGFLAHNISRNNTAELQAEIDKLIADGKVDYCEGEVDDKITEHTRKALTKTAYSGKPFFMMIEEARIDKRSHDGNLSSAMDKVMWYNDAIVCAATYAMIDWSTVVIVTADHETGGLIEDANAQYGFKYTTGNHTNADVPVYALGYGTEIFNGKATENTDIAKFIATHFGAESFGQ